MGCHLGERGPLVQQGERCPPRMVLNFIRFSVRIVFNFTRNVLFFKLFLCKLKKNKLRDVTTFEYKTSLELNSFVVSSTK